MNDLHAEIVKRSDGHFFRVILGDEAALWHGPFPTELDAEQTMMDHIEAYVTAGVKMALGMALGLD